MSQHYKIGFHLGPGGNATGIGAWMQRLDAAAIPFFLKSVDHYGPCHEAMQYNRAPHTVVFRLSRAGQGTGYNFDVPDYSLTPLAAASKHWAQIKLRLPPEFNKRVWLEPINEVDRNRADWLGKFGVAIAQLANDEGYKVALFAWSAGEPDAAAWETPGMAEYLKRCAARPADCAVAVHEYSYNKANIKDGWPHKIGRFAVLFTACDRLKIPRPKVLITEWGWEYQNVPDESRAMGDMAWAADVYATYPDVLGAATWYLGGGAEWGNIANQVQKLIAPAGDAAAAYRYMRPDLPADFPPPNGVSGGDPGGGTPPVTWETLYEYHFNVYNDYAPASPDWYDVGAVHVPLYPERWEYQGWKGPNPYGDGQPWNNFSDLENRIIWGAFLGNQNEWPLFLNGKRSLRDNKVEPGGFGIHCFAPTGAHRFRYKLPTRQAVKGTTYRIRLWFHGDWATVVNGQKTTQGLEPDHAQVELSINTSGVDQFKRVSMIGDNMMTFEWTAAADGPLDARWGFLTRFANSKGPNGVFVKGVWIERKVVSEPPPTPPASVPVARTGYKRITVLIHPTDGAPYAIAAATASWKSGDPSLPHYFTIGASADDAGVPVLYESSGELLPIARYVIAVNPERWGPGDDGRGLQGFFERYYGGFGGVRYVPLAAATPADLARLLDNFDPDHPPPPAPAVVHIPIDPILSQRDPRWAAVVMGTGSDGKVKTIGNWGCLDVAYTLLAKQLGIASLTPDQMWAHLKAKGATSGPNLLAGALATAYPTQVQYEGHQQRGEGLHERIMRHLDGGITVPARVDFVPATPDQFEQHWVLINGYDPAGGRFRICDPWHGDEVWVDERYDITGDDILEALFYVPKTTTPPEPGYTYTGPAVTFAPALHQPGSDWEWARPQAQAQYTKTGLPVKWLSDGVNADYYGQFNKPAFHLVRVMWKPDRKKTPAEAWADVKDGVLRFYNKGARRFELHNEPNLAQEGWGMVWSNPDELGAWLREWAVIIRQACPLAKLYFPGFSPGVPWTNQFAISVRAWSLCKDLMSGFAMHAYTGITNDEAAAANEIVNQVKELQKHLNLQVPLVVSEASVNRAAAASYKAAVYRRIEAGLRDVPGVEAVCWYIASWEQVPPEQADHQESWAAWGIGDAYAALP